MIIATYSELFSPSDELPLIISLSNFTSDCYNFLVLYHYSIYQSLKQK